ncbi:MAG: hypothetical protein AAGK01_03085 [Pseudomonadota bacterium]
MRIAVFVITACSLIAAPASSEDETIATPLGNPAYSDPAAPWKTVSDAKNEAVLEQFRGVQLPSQDDESCQDRITKARELFGQSPLLKRDPASPDKPHLIYAVDRRQDGCSVIVMKGAPDDIRPLPSPMTGAPLLLPADAAEE